MSVIPNSPADTAFDAGNALTQEEDRILAHIAEIDAALAEAKDPNADADHDFSEEGGEGAAASVDRDRDTTMRAQLVERLDRIEDARRRLAAGTYGTCATCEKPIGEARLEALPAVIECVTCASTPILARRSR